jgi:hypothetical protein
MCTTLAECKTVVTIVPTVMSGMDPHMVSETWDGFWLSFGWVMSNGALLGFGSIMVRLCDAIEVVIFEEMSLLPCY